MLCILRKESNIIVFESQDINDIIYVGRLTRKKTFNFT